MTENLKQQLEQFARGMSESPDDADMFALTLIYHEEFEPAILGIIQRGMTVARYTKIHEVVGARTDMLQTADYQPHGHNCMLILFAERQVVHEMAEELRILRKTKRHGLRGFVTPVAEVI